MIVEHTNMIFSFLESEKETYKEPGSAQRLPGSLRYHHNMNSLGR